MERCFTDPVPLTLVEVLRDTATTSRLAAGDHLRRQLGIRVDETPEAPPPAAPGALQSSWGEGQPQRVKPARLTHYW
jgi:hypothetical protein